MQQLKRLAPLFLAGAVATLPLGCRAPGEHDGAVDADGDADVGSDGDGDDDSDTVLPDADELELSITSVQPGHGPFSGGSSVLVRGRRFEQGAIVSFGSHVIEPVDTQVLDDNRIAVVTPPAAPGAVDVSVDLPSGDTALLEEGYVYDPWFVDPVSGSVAGGTLVTLTASGIEFEPESTVSFDGSEARDLVWVGPTEMTCRTPPGAVGPADVAVEGVTGTLVLREGFSYYDSSDPLNGGLGGGPIEGTIDVTVLDAMTSEPLSDSFVILGTDGATRFQGLTDAGGKITFSDRSLSGRQVITASHLPVPAYDEEGEEIGETTYETTTIVEFDARSVTIFLTPVPPPQPGPPPPGRMGGYVEGELLFEHQGEFGPYEWQIIPGPTPPDEVKAAYVYTSIPAPRADSSDLSPRQGSIVLDTEEYRGANGYEFEVYSRAGAVAVYALAGILNTVTQEFHPYAMGVTRGVIVDPDGTVSGVQVYMTRQLSTNLSVLLEGAPEPDLSGTPNLYRVDVVIELGAEGAIAQPGNTQRSTNPLVPFWFPGWTELTGNLADAHYTVVAGAWTVREGSDEEANPWSVVVERGITDPEVDIVIDRFLGVPRPVAPEPGASVVDGQMEWEATGTTPDFSLAMLAVPGGLMPIPYWTVVLRGGETSYELLDLAMLAGMPEPPPGDAIWQVWSFSVPGFDFDGWSYRYLSSRYWSAYTADGWYIRLREDT